METLAASVWEALDAHVSGAELVSYGGRQTGLVWFIPRAWWRTFRAVRSGRCDSVLTGDALMFIALWPLVTLLRVPTATMVMGLDITWPRAWYQAVVRRVIPRARRVLAISRATADVARAMGVPDAHVAVVRLGVGVPAVTTKERLAARVTLHRRLGLPDDAVLIGTLGRLVERKGFRWFVSNVMSRLPQSVHYVIAGSGREHDAIVAAAAAHGVGERVHLVGAVDDEMREVVLRGADLFVQPNIPVPGDMEGFGLVVIETAQRGTPVVGSALEGVQDAIVDHTTGLLCPPADADAWVATLDPLVADPDGLVALGATFGEQARVLYGLDALATAVVDQLDHALARD
jgi:glycosyltransferase involved in cell wall biosynthesis